MTRPYPALLLVLITPLAACLAATWIVLSTAALASEEAGGNGSTSGEAGSSKGLASVLIEGASEAATVHIDGRALKIPYQHDSTSPLRSTSVRPKCSRGYSEAGRFASR